MAETPIEDDDGVGATIVQIAGDARAYAAAQVALYKALARARVRAAQGVFVFGAAAAVLAGGALTGLIFGMILTLSPRFGPFGATSIVVVVTMVLAAIFGVFAKRRFDELMDDIE